ncbi:MAG: hypothetical protein FWD57_14595 [Polyangiaceae bacterium]|nr:hypothetical protein [Polyangiaceae bacterium]
MIPCFRKVLEHNAPIKRRIVVFLLSSLIGIVAGMSADLLGPMRFDFDYIVSSLVLSPALVTLCGVHVTIAYAKPICTFGGFLFIPVYVVLAVWCVKKPTCLAYPAVCLWCMQGFFQLCHRLPPIMGI